MTGKTRTSSTILGLASIVVWSTSIGFSLSLKHQVGALTAASYMYLIGGGLGLVYVGLVLRRLGHVFRMPPKYLLGCGGLFVAYETCLYLALCLVKDNQQGVEVGILNYLWPGLTLVFAVPILGAKAKIWLLPGAAIAFVGAAFALLQENGQASFSPSAMVANFTGNPMPYLLGLGAAITWAMYSNFSRRWAGGSDDGAVPLFLLVSGVVLLILRPFFPEQEMWTSRALLEMAFMTIVTSLLAYVFWEAAMRNGNVTLLASVSYLIPIFSTILSVLYLGVKVGWTLWVSCGMVVVGAVICKMSVKEVQRPIPPEQKDDIFLLP